MVSKVCSGAVIGIDAQVVEIEVNISAAGGVPGRDGMVSIVGLPDAAVKESRDRIFPAFTSSGFIPPRGFAVVNLAPAGLRKEGAAFDLGIALGLLASNGSLDPGRLAGFAALGELALDGSIRPVRGALPLADRLAAEKGLSGLLVPESNAREAALAAGDRLPVYPVTTLADAVKVVSGELTRMPFKASLSEYIAGKRGYEPDFNEVKGQPLARRALEIAAAGGHNVIMIGSPGTGKSMLATRLPGILPPMTMAETLETSRIHSVLGMLSSGEPILDKRPFRAPHHTISDVGLIGGGHDPHPGEISLAHNGVLFLDELPEFKRSVLEVLRQPLENGIITISRASGSCTFPARFILCAAMNPCPCGMGDAELGCTCKVDEKRRYQKKISGPLLDRIDLQVDVRQLNQDELLRAPDGESSASIRRRVAIARKIQERRYAPYGFYCNAQLSSRGLQTFCKLTPAEENMLRSAITRFKLSPRAFDRVLKVARTIADLAGRQNIGEDHLFEAITYRKSALFDL